MSAEPAAPGLYLHVPFCSSICPYCDFSVVHTASPGRERFASRLAAEVELAAPEWRDPRPFDTVYLGGGTPSQLRHDELSRVLDACRAHLPLAAPAPWIFLEANPEDVTTEACASWRSLGVRTLSLGVQSFSDETLHFLGRRHDGRQAREAIETARPGSVLVIDCRGDVRAGSLGGILAARLRARGAAGVVTDGAVRDAAGIAAGALPVYAAGRSAAISLSVHHAADCDVPIACAGVAVSPGIGFGERGDGHVRFALVENEQRIAQAARGIKSFLSDEADWVEAARNGIA